MDTSRLSTISVELVDYLTRCGDVELREIADKAAMFALSHTGGVPTQVIDLRRQLKQGLFGDTYQRDVVEKLAAEYDEIYWISIENATDSKESDKGMKSFLRARAITAAWSCAESLPLQAALDACYEAAIAVGDVTLIKEAIGKK